MTATTVPHCPRCGHRLLTAEDAYYHDCAGAPQAESDPTFGRGYPEKLVLRAGEIATKAAQEATKENLESLTRAYREVWDRVFKEALRRLASQ